MRVLVTDGETRAALAAVRSLGAAGHTVHVACAATSSLAGGSRHAATEHAIGVAARDPGAWAERIEALAVALNADLILPVTEIAMGNVYAFGIASRRPVACPERGAYEAAIDKYALLERAEKVGLDAPRSVLIEQVTSLDELPTSFDYPVVLKPRRSHRLVEGRWLSPEVRILRNDADLRAAREDLELQGDVVLQEYLPGHGEGVFLLTAAGRCVASFAHRRLREKPPTGGQSVLRESITADPALLAASQRLLADLDWTGVAMVEFRRTPEGRAAVMEVNPRLWGSLQLAVDSGVDFPALLISIQRGEPVPTVRARAGVRTRWLLGDLDHLLISLRRPEVRRETGKSVPRLLADFVRSFGDGTRLEILRWDDWQPFLRELAGRLAGG